MKFTLSWLKDHLETEASLDKIVETLTMIGLEADVRWLQHYGFRPLDMPTLFGGLSA